LLLSRHRSKSACLGSCSFCRHKSILSVAVQTPRKVDTNPLQVVYT
jgi:hypothetical protein